MPDIKLTGAYLRRSPTRMIGVVVAVVLLHLLAIAIFMNFGHKVRVPDELIRVTIVKAKR
jgi:hypothetical protein